MLFHVTVMWITGYPIKIQTGYLPYISKALPLH